MRDATHLLLHVVKRIRRVDSETDEDDVGVGVAEGSKPIVVFLTGSIPQGKLYVFPIDLHIGDVVLEHGGDIDLGYGKACADANIATTVNNRVSQMLRTTMYAPLGTFLSRTQSTNRSVGRVRRQVRIHMFVSRTQGNGQTFPQAPSPTITSFLRISDIFRAK